MRCCCRDLSPCHAISQVVDTDHREVHVPPGSVDEVVSADGAQITVTRKDDDVSFGFGHLYPGGKWDRPAVGGVEGIDVDVTGAATRATDPRYHGKALIWNARLLDGRETCSENRADAAAGTPDMGDTLSADEVFQWMRGDCFAQSAYLQKLSFNARITLSGEMIVPPGCPTKTAGVRPAHR